MALPITIPYTFANATTSIPLSNLDSDFTTVVNAVNGIGNGTNAIVATNANVTSSGSNTPRTLAQRFADVTNVLDFGAIGDGTTDDTAAINAANTAAATSGATVFFPSGIYKVNSSGVVMKSSWLGDGPENSIISSTASTYANYADMVSIRDSNGFVLENMGFDISSGIFPPGTGNPGNVMTAFQAINCKNWIVQNCHFTGIQAHTIGCAVDGGDSWTIDNCYFYMPTPTNTYNQAINISTAAGNTTNYNVTNNFCVGTAIFTNASYGVFANNVIRGQKFGGGITSGPQASPLCAFLTMTNNVCYGSTGLDINDTYPAGIECWAPYSTITGNICYNNSGHGISIGANSINVVNNLCLNNGQSNGSGICAYSIPGFAASSCIVVGNNCSDSQGTPTQLYGYAEYVVGGADITHMTVADNIFANNKNGTTLISSSFLSWRGPNLTITTAANPGTLLNNTSSSGTYALSGARLGDSVAASFGASLQGCTINAYVSSTNAITVVFTNNTGSSVTLSSSSVSLNISVAKPLNYSNY